MNERNDLIARLYDAADDYELGVLDSLLERAGAIWTCPVRPWTNMKGEECGECGRTEDEAREWAAAEGFDEDEP